MQAPADAFGNLLHEAWLLKRQMNSSVSNSFVDDIYSKAIQCGAIGGKLLGAGGSGYLLVYAHESCQSDIKDIFSEDGIIQEEFQYSHEGLQTWDVPE